MQVSTRLQTSKKIVENELTFVSPRPSGGGYQLPVTRNQELKRRSTLLVTANRSGGPGTRELVTGN